MIEPNYINEMDIDISGDFFDHIDDLLNFPNEDVEGGVVGEDFNGFQGIWSDPPDALVGSASVFSNNSTNNSSELPTDLSVSNEDIAHLEWLSNFVEDSFSAGSIILDEDLNENNNNNNNNNSNSNKDTHQFRTSSPVESSSSCSEGKTETKKPLRPQTVIPGRARSKRPRPATFNPRSVHPLISSPSSITDSIPPISTTSEFENFAESHPSKKIMKPEVTEENKKKKKEKKLPRQSGTIQSDLLQQPITVRKCLHCEITKTPQWRTGPMGPKTLCNACGVRHKSGRLFPEYRPAASPTFVASLHSCSHKKVLEMRIKDGGQKISADENVSTMMTTANLPELIPRSSYLPDYI